jgi:suppressor for copper-sensitivity B
VEARIRLDALVCSDVCVPVAMDLALSVPPGEAAPDGPAANLIERWASLVPGDGVAAGLSLTGAAAANGGRTLVVEAAAREPFSMPDVFVEAPPEWAFGTPEITLGPAGATLSAALPVLQAPQGAALAGLPLILTLVDGARAVEAAASVGTSSPIGAPTGAGPGLLAMLAAAVLGGLILNLMPCVLPVLSLKLVAVLGKAGKAPAEVRLGFLAGAAGILASFLVLAAALSGLKAAGLAVGWGIQFQQPLFLVFMILLLTLFACNLLGLFEVVLPHRLADAAGRASGGRGLAGHFATGAFATLLATPCSAPFLGTAVGFALSRGAPEIFAIFAAVALGLALPWLAVAAMPGAARLLPRPGPWIVTLRRLLALALFATAAWLIVVLSAEVSPIAAWLTAALVAGIGLLIWGRTRTLGAARLALGMAAVLLAVLAFALPGRVPGIAGEAAAEATSWAAFDEARIPGLVAEGKVVLVDVTADWCLTCQANKLFVLGRGEVARRLAGDGVVPMRADWTRPDEAIAAYLARWDRYGIPFYAVYGPAAPDGITLPEILTEEAVLAALARAGGAG